MSEPVLTRAEILGGLIRDARLQVGRTNEECARVLGQSADDFNAIENGEVAPSGGYMILRQRIIGTKLGQERRRAKRSIDELADQTGISADVISGYESGTEPIPYFELETLAAKIDISVKSFVDDEPGPLAHSEIDLELEERIKEWSPELRAFIADSRNEIYLDSAMRLSEMGVDRLRAIAEGILEITL
jgi:transcriptional regulator with XRE-family HTH domain